MSFITAPGALVGYTNLQNTAAPNTVIPVSYFRASSGTAPNVDAAIVPKGSQGAILGAIPDNLTTGGDKRGQGAVDLQLYRLGIGASGVASGSFAGLVAGQDNIASGSDAFGGGGSLNTATQQGSAFIGGQNLTVDGVNSRAGGNQASVFGMLGVDVWSPNSGNTTGGRQLMDTVMTMNTGTAVPAILNTVGGSGAVQPGQADRNFVMKNNSLMSVDAFVVCNGNGTGEFASFRVSGIVQRLGGAATSVVRQKTITPLANSAAFAACACDLIADTTAGGWDIQVTGIAATNMQWVASVRAHHAMY